MRSCSVERLLARDYLVTGESEGREEPLESVGTTRHGRGKEWHAKDSGVAVKTRGYGFNEPNIDVLLVSECSGDPGTRKPVLLRSNYQSEIVRLCCLFALLHAILLVSACFVLWAERLTRQPRLEIDNLRRPRNSRTGLPQCFPSVLMCSETIAISVCQKRVPKACFRVPFIYLWIGHPEIPVRKAFANVREYPSLSRRPLKCARRHHWSFWYQEGFLEFHIGYLLTLRSCPRVCVFAYVDHLSGILLSLLMRPWSESLLAFSVRVGGPKWGADNTNPIRVTHLGALKLLTLKWHLRHFMTHRHDYKLISDLSHYLGRMI
ncbi:hypothetical protein CRG98_018932 [Punica granatum]|uniref:Uncharacterized protein n=1 Tax=Punica granatum TaxID=22663 RepID=A0A2I0JWN5_PUNGR|nr:hypothetical protein CRG98_018932 [Punica granatum]